MATNFLQHNPTEANQDNDAQYLVDNTRTQGLGVDEIVPSIWMNKILYQISTFVAAFAQMMSNKGYNCSDADINVLEGVLANVITNADTKPGFITVPYSSTPVFNAALASGFRFTMSGGVTSSTLTNISFGQILTFIIQDTLNLPFPWPSNVLGGYALSNNVPSGVNTQQFVVLEDNNAYSITTMVNRLIDLVNNLQDQINALSATINGFQPQINTINTHLTTLDNQIVAQNGENTNLQNQINSLNTNKQNNLGFTPVRQGGGNLQLNNSVLIGWSNAGRLRAQVDATDLGQFVFDGNMVAYVASQIAGLFAGSLAGNGWIALGSLIVQWGSTGTIPEASGGSSTTINFPRAFPNICFVVDITCRSSPGNEGRTMFTRGTPTTTSFQIGSNGNDASAFFVAFGI